MQTAFFMTIFFMILLLLLMIVLIGLEIFLAKSEKWWPGMLPPLCPFLSAAFLCLNVSASGNVLQSLLLTAGVFMLLNIPTYILLAVYFVCRKNKDKKKMLDKMNIRDLN